MPYEIAARICVNLCNIQPWKRMDFDGQEWMFAPCPRPLIHVADAPALIHGEAAGVMSGSGLAQARFGADPLAALTLHKE